MPELHMHHCVRLSAYIMRTTRLRLSVDVTPTARYGYSAV